MTAECTAAVCAGCRAPLEPDEIAVTRKLINRGTRTWYCRKCLAAYFEITVDDVNNIIERCKQQGCTLFL